MATSYDPHIARPTENLLSTYPPTCTPNLSPLRCFPMTHEHILLELLAQLLIFRIPQSLAQPNPRRNRQVSQRVRCIFLPSSLAHGLGKILPRYDLRFIGPVLLERRQPVRHVLELPLGRVLLACVCQIRQVVLFHPATAAKNVRTVSNRKEQHTSGKGRGGKGGMEQCIRTRGNQKHIRRRVKMNDKHGDHTRRESPGG